MHSLPIGRLWRPESEDWMPCIQSEAEIPRPPPPCSGVASSGRPKSQWWLNLAQCFRGFLEKVDSFVQLIFLA